MKSNYELLLDALKSQQKINDQVKELKNSVKEDMLATKQTSIKMLGKQFSITKSSESYKFDLSAFKGKEPNLYSALFNKYYKKHEVKSFLRVSDIKKGKE